MKKYRLIKEYPGSPQSGYILEQLKNNKNQNDNYYYNGIWLNPLKYPEFWEEIVEKDYEILEIRGKYGVIFSYNEELDNDLKDKTIFKIKRLSDGEIFTIGDISEFGKIIGFLYDVDLNKIFSQTETSKRSCVLSCLKKIKQPLFTTEDGKEIFKGDKFFIVGDKFFIYEGVAFDKDIRHYVRHFSTKEAAEKYILMNKPCLSINDVIKEFNMTLSIQIGIQKLINLV